MFLNITQQSMIPNCISSSMKKSAPKNVHSRKLHTVQQNSVWTVRVRLSTRYEYCMGKTIFMGTIKPNCFNLIGNFSSFFCCAYTRLFLILNDDDEESEKSEIQEQWKKKKEFLCTCDEHLQ